MAPTAPARTPTPARPRRRILALAAATGTTLVLGLAGCSGSAASGEESDDETTGAVPTGESPSSTTAGTPSPTATAGGDDDGDDGSSTDPSTWRIDDDEIGPIEIGEPFDATLDALSDGWSTVEGCEWVASWTAEDSSYQIWFQAEDEQTTGDIVGVHVDWLGDRTGVGPRTEDGLGVGSTREEVLEAHPRAEDVPPAQTDTWYVRIPDDDDSDDSDTDDDDATLFFQFMDQQDGAQSVALTSRDTPAYEPCA